MKAKVGAGNTKRRRRNRATLATAGGLRSGRRPRRKSAPKPTVMPARLLILEASWADSRKDHLADGRRTSRIYSSIEALLQLIDEPIIVVVRPLLQRGFSHDIKAFTSLPANAQRGINVIVLSGHGCVDEEKGTRVIQALDGRINLSRELIKLKDDGVLNRTVLILDSCEIGLDPKSLRQECGALGVIGFGRPADWTDSSVFILAMLLKFQAAGFSFH